MLELVREYQKRMLGGRGGYVSPSLINLEVILGDNYLHLSQLKFFFLQFIMYCNLRYK